MGELNEHTSDSSTSKWPWVSVCMLESMVSAGSFCRRHRILAVENLGCLRVYPHSPRDTNSPVSSWNVNWAPWDLCGILGFGMLHLTFGFSGCKKSWLWSMNRNEIEGDPLASGSPVDPIEKVALLDLLLEPLTNHSRRSSSIFKHTNGSPSRSIFNGGLFLCQSTFLSKFVPLWPSRCWSSTKRASTPWFAKINNAKNIKFSSSPPLSRKKNCPAYW